MTNTTNLSHQQLVEHGAKWLKQKIKCPVIAMEIKCVGSREIPDVIGFRSDSSFLIECKTSTADFIADFKKPERVGLCSSLGNYRLYLAQKGVLLPDLIPESWGILEIDLKGKIEVIRFLQGNIFQGANSPTELKQKDPYFHESDPNKERAVLYSLLRR